MYRDEEFIVGYYAGGGVVLGRLDVCAEAVAAKERGGVHGGAFR